MTVIVKIMESGNKLADSDNRASYQLYTGVHYVQFSRDLTGQAFISMHLDRVPSEIGEATEGDFAKTNIHRELHSPAYVMSETGKTISTFDGRSTGVDVQFNDATRTLAQGPMTMGYLRQVFSLKGSDNLYRQTSRSNSLYGRTIPLAEHVLRGEDLWETVGDGEHIIYISSDEVFSTTLPEGAKLDDPKPEPKPD